MAILLRVGHEPQELPNPGQELSLKDMQQMVGGYIEMVRLSNGKQALIINEEGKLKGLPTNPTATLLVADVLREQDYIVGDAILAEIGTELV